MKKLLIAFTLLVSMSSFADISLAKTRYLGEQKLTLGHNFQSARGILLKLTGVAAVIASGGMAAPLVALTGAALEGQDSKDQIIDAGLELRLGSLSSESTRDIMLSITSIEGTKILKNCPGTSVRLTAERDQEDNFSYIVYTKKDNSTPRTLVGELYVDEFGAEINFSQALLVNDLTSSANNIVCTWKFFKGFTLILND